MKDYDVLLHTKGQSQYVDDRIVPEGILTVAVFASPIAHGKILSLDTSDAKNIPGVQAILTAKDIPGQNQIGNIVADEELLAEKNVYYVGQPIAVVAADSPKIARLAIQKIRAKFQELPPIFDAREAYVKNELIIPPRIFSLGNTENAFKKCDLTVEGRVDTGGQEHIYLETQGAMAFFKEDGGLNIVASTQSPSVVQGNIARILQLPMHKVEVDVLRLGGGFGGKQEQAGAWACLTALTAFVLKKPAKLILKRDEDVLMTGKRHPYSADFKIGLKKDGTILAYDVMFYQNAGAASDVSPAVLEKTLTHAANTYYVPAIRARGASCRTNLAPNTAFRGFGAPQAMLVMEAAIHKAAEKMGVDVMMIQQKNIIKKGQKFIYGMKNESNNSVRCFEELVKKHKLDLAHKQIKKFNQSNALVKKGLAIAPVCFGISFGNFFDQASALVHIYNDGSVGISTAAVEMGQGVNAKIRRVVSMVFSVKESRIKVESTNTTRNANTSPTAASVGADLNGNAARIACEVILGRLKKFVAKKTNTRPTDIVFKNENIYLKNKKIYLNWQTLIQNAYAEKIGLSEHAHYATPKIYLDTVTEKGRPFAYHVFGAAAVEATVDCVRGTYTINSVKIIHDSGKSLNEKIDRGQIEGAVVQGMGWTTLEDLKYNNAGRLLTTNLSTYKIPDIYFAPKDIEIDFLQNSFNHFGPFNSKAIGEPPLMYGVGAYFALINAIKSFSPVLKFEFTTPLTPEKILLMLYKKPALNI